MRAIDYAGFWDRCGALVIDVVIMALPSAIIGYIFSSAFADHMAMRGADDVTSEIGGMLWAKLSGIAVAWVYYASMESSIFQGTLGKHILGLKVVDLDGRRLTFGRASGRFFGRVVSAIPFGAGFLIQPFTAKKQTLHDILASCLVVKAIRTHTTGTERICETAIHLPTGGKNSDIASQVEERAYEESLQETESGELRKGLWAKAFAVCQGNEQQAKAKYIELRTAQIIAEAKDNKEQVVVGTQYADVVRWRLLSNAIGTFKVCNDRFLYEAKDESVDIAFASVKTIFRSWSELIVELKDGRQYRFKGDGLQVSPKELLNHLHAATDHGNPDIATKQ